MQIGWVVIRLALEKVTRECECLCPLRFWDLDSETGFLIKIETKTRHVLGYEDTRELEAGNQ